MSNPASMKGIAARRLAVEVLMKIELEGAFAKTALQEAFKHHSLIEKDRAFTTALVQGATRHLEELDSIIERLSKRSKSKLTPALRAVLRVAVFQLLYMDDIPPSAVLNTAVQIARKTGHEGSAKFTNGVLRTLVREKDKNVSPEKAEEESSDSQAELRNLGEEPTKSTKDSVNSLRNAAKHQKGSVNSTKNSVYPEKNSVNSNFSLPPWLVERWQRNFSQEECQKLLEYTQEIPKLTLRTCESGISPDGLARILSEKGMKVSHGNLVPGCLIIEDRGPVSGPISKIPGYSDGLFVVQDEAAAFVSLVVDPKPGQTILDMCAAPGGKALHMGELMENKGRVVAADISQKRLDLIAPERRRLSLTNVEVVQTDGRSYAPGVLFDSILIDAPCTGTGVINRRADIRQRRKEIDLSELVTIQRAMLGHAAGLVKDGGTLVYSTCSIEPEENLQNIDWFLSTHRQFSSESLERFFSEALLESWKNEEHWQATDEQIKAGKLQLLPSRHSTSGFFIARLRKDKGKSED